MAQPESQPSNPFQRRQSRLRQAEGRVRMAVAWLSWRKVVFGLGIGKPMIATGNLLYNMRKRLSGFAHEGATQGCLVRYG
jgi:hypothetical protein